MHVDAVGVHEKAGGGFDLLGHVAFRQRVGQEPAEDLACVGIRVLGVDSARRGPVRALGRRGDAYDEGLAGDFEGAKHGIRRWRNARAVIVRRASAAGAQSIDIVADPCGDDVYPVQRVRKCGLGRAGLFDQ